MYKNILIPISFDVERDISEPLRLANFLSSTESEVTLLHVVEPVPSFVRNYIPDEELKKQRKIIKAEMNKLTMSETNIKSLVIEGHAGRTIIDWTRGNKPDLIILSSRKPKMPELLLGSTASHVVRYATCSVHVVR